MQAAFRRAAELAATGLQASHIAQVVRQPLHILTPWLKVSPCTPFAHTDAGMALQAMLFAVYLSSSQAGKAEQTCAEQLHESSNQP